MMDEKMYRIPKHEVPAQVWMEKQESAVERIFFLNPVSPYGRPETLAERLEAPPQFLPVKCPEEGRVELLPKNAMIFVKESDPLDAPVSMRFHLVFRNGAEFEVGHFRQLPEAHSRVLDYLNQPSHFAAFELDGRRIYCNKAMILKVVVE